jgi:hypothetical protein
LSSSPASLSSSDDFEIGSSLDAWIAEHESDMTRPEAIRHLVEKALRSSRGTSKRKAQKASEMADRAVEHIVDNR